MEQLLYGILGVYFLLGGVLIALVNRGKDATYRKNSWVKYFVYLVLINALFIAILWNKQYFHYAGLVIMAFGLYEIFRNMLSTGKYPIGLISLLLFSVLAFPFYHFTLLDRPWLFYTLFLTTVFDAFSQLSGQLFGKRKILPGISPNKTLEGTIGGVLFAVATSVMIRGLIETTLAGAIFLSLGLAAAAFFGDLLASLAKRKFGIKDFSQLIPGHGGFLDRFDSLLATGSFVYIYFSLSFL
ncbi:MAG: phosphatidate cytidylyltransferase [Bacteroidetes bacterium]|nr:MAG: phosphatidate cytidylyltransferase [Bacteroidota bacterium]